MKRILLLACLAIGGVATLAGCYDCPDVGTMSPNDTYRCFCDREKQVPEGSPAPECHGKPMKLVIR